MIINGLHSSATSTIKRNYCSSKEVKTLVGNNYATRKEQNNHFEALKNYNLATITFKGNSQQLEVLKALSSDDAFSFIKDCKSTPLDFKNLMLAITSDKEASQILITAITSNPRESKNIIKLLSSKMGNEQNLKEWLFSPKGYLQAYNNFANQYYKEAKSVEDLLKLQPNWTIWSLKDKYAETHDNSNFIIGAVPEEFGTKDTFYWLINEANHGSAGNKDYKIKALPSGLSDKKSFIIEHKNKKYILKTDINPDHKYENDSNKENKALKSDSVFLNAAIDYYLNSHNCENAAGFKYYDFYHNAALYECSEGSDLPAEYAGHQEKVNSMLSDLNKLGIIYNDVNPNNFKISEDGSIKIIDIGESCFVDALRPGVPGLHTTLPNYYGTDLTSIYASLYLALHNN